MPMLPLRRLAPLQSGLATRITRNRSKTAFQTSKMAFATTPRPMTVTVSKPSLFSPYPDDAKELKHHLKDGKGFHNHWPSFVDPGGFEVGVKMARRKMSGNHNPDLTPPTVPVVKSHFLPSREKTQSLRATWLGHACYLVEFPSGLRVLFDPVFTERCSPLTFLGPKRYTKMPCQIEDIPLIDAVVISHNHYDHMSYPTLTKIAAKHPNAQFFVPMNLAEWFQSNDMKHVTELDWWQSSEFHLSYPRNDVTKGDKPMHSPGGANELPEDIIATFSCVPCQHASARSGFDRSRTLWASWAVKSGGKSVYFAGDTGYRTVPELPPDEFDYGEEHADLPVCPAFKQIGELRGPFDLGLIPIGAYEPRYIMSPLHSNPYDSVNIFVDTQCKRALAMHWGTWVLTEEEVLEPKKKLRDALRWKGLPEEGRFDVCDIGESREF